MTFWADTYRVEAAAVEKDPGFYWQGMDDMTVSPASDNISNDLLGQFVNFDADGMIDSASFSASSVNGFQNPSSGIACITDSLILRSQADSTVSSAVSSADEFDFLSTSSQVGPVMSATSLEFDAKDLPFRSNTDLNFPKANHQNPNYLRGRGSMSDTELQRLEEISIHSPDKPFSASHPTSPTPPNTSRKQGNRFVEAISSTIRKATTLRRTKKQPMVDRSSSPTLENPPMAIKQDSLNRFSNVAHDSAPESSPTDMGFGPPSAGFIHGMCPDPFADISRQGEAPYYNQGNPEAVSLSMSSPGSGGPGHEQQSRTYQADPGQMHVQQPGSWPQHMIPVSGAEQWASSEYVTSPGWWGGEMNMFTDAKNASVNQAMHSQHAELPYEYNAAMHANNSDGLMIQIPHGQAPGVNNLALTPQTYLPPPPIPAERERSSRPPRAPSSGARHRNLSTSPMRKTRGPSASPQPQGAINPSRHSSSGSVSSVRSTSGRAVNGSIPNTPSGVRKRRSRDTVGGGGGGDNMGFVNFTPNDGSVLMTGVAPSGSSKTKARREKEAQEKRRRLSEAAMKAVAAAGGDVDKLIQEGFVF